MIWKRLRKYGDEQEGKAPGEHEDMNVSFRERLIMTLTAYVVILLPCLLVLAVLCLLMMWLFGLL